MALRPFQNSCSILLQVKTKYIYPTNSESEIMVVIYMESCKLLLMKSDMPSKWLVAKLDNAFISSINLLSQKSFYFMYSYRCIQKEKSSVSDTNLQLSISALNKVQVKFVFYGLLHFACHLNSIILHNSKTFMYNTTGAIKSAATKSSNNLKFEKLLMRKL